MQNSSYKIFCLYKRIPYTFEQMNFDMYPRLEEPVERRWFDHTTQFIKKQCFRLFNEIENSWYTYDDLVAFLIYRSLWDSAVKLTEVTDASMQAFKAEFTEAQLKKDREVIAKINKPAGLRDISEYFIIRENGESLIYGLCMKKIVSVYFFANYADTLLTGLFHRANLKNRSKKYRKFDETVNILTKQLNLETYKSKVNT